MDKLGGWNGERYEAKFHATSYSHHHCSLLFLRGEDSASSTLSPRSPPLSPDCLLFPLGRGGDGTAYLQDPPSVSYLSRLLFLCLWASSLRLQTDFSFPAAACSLFLKLLPFSP